MRGGPYDDVANARPFQAPSLSDCPPPLVERPALRAGSTLPGDELEGRGGEAARVAAVTGGWPAEAAPTVVALPLPATDLDRRVRPLGAI